MLLSWPKKMMLPAMALPPQGTRLLSEHRTLGIRAEGYAWSPPALLAGVFAVAHMEELYMYTYLYASIGQLLNKYGLINALMIISTDSLLQQIKIKHMYLPFKKGSAGPRLTKPPTMDGAWPAVGRPWSMTTETAAVVGKAL